MTAMPILRNYALPDLAATGHLARLLVPVLKTGDVLTLQGGLGAGKTSFARYLLQELGVTGDIPSPTYTLVQDYETSLGLIHHFDLYRLNAPEDLEELGWHEALTCGVSIIEWPERAEGLLPASRLHLEFSQNEDGVRHCSIMPCGAWAERFKAVAL